MQHARRAAARLLARFMESTGVGPGTVASAETERAIRVSTCRASWARGRVYCLFLLPFELFLVFAHDLPALAREGADTIWRYKWYLVLHLGLAVAALAGFLASGAFLRARPDGRPGKGSGPEVGEPLAALLCALILSQVAAITALDQAIPGAVDAYAPSLLIVALFSLVRFLLAVPMFLVPHAVFAFSLWLVKGTTESFLASVTNGSVVVAASILFSAFIRANHRGHLLKNALLSEANAALAHLAAHDILTGLPNRRRFEEFARHEIAKAARFREDWAVALVDLDHFKSVNDRHGHAAGDAALVAIARALSSSMRETDLVARWGGEEFIAFFPRVTPGEALAAAERVRLTIADVRVSSGGEEIALTASVGVRHVLAPAPAAIASRADPSPESAPCVTLEEACADADAALYRAKAAGRDRVVFS